MEKKQIDWSSIGFGYIPTEKRYVSNYKDGKILQEDLRCRYSRKTVL